MSFDFDDPFDPMSPFFLDEFIFNEEDEPKKRKTDRDNSGYDDPDADDDDERDDW